MVAGTGAMAPGEKRARPGSRAGVEGSSSAATSRARPEARRARRAGEWTSERSGWAGFTSSVATISTLVTSLAAVAALLFTGLSLQQTRDQNQLDVSGQITDRFNAAVTNLGSDTETIRIGGIYALQRIMQDSPRDQSAVIQVLAAFIREDALPPSSGATAQATASAGALTDPASTTPSVPIDVQTALTVLSTRDMTHDGIPSLDLEGAYLPGADLEGAQFYNVNLTGAYLPGANLTDTSLTLASLTDANLNGADLTGAFLNSAILTNVNLTDANLTGAILANAILANANLTGANLTDANLYGTPWCNGLKPVKPGGYVCSE